MIGDPLPPGEVELSLDGRVAAGGDALGRLPDGRVVFVEGGLPGEVVRAELVEERRDYARARALEVLRAHPGRRAPACPELSRGCGGCQLQHADVTTQRSMKEVIVADALTRIGRLGRLPPLRSVATPSEGYRTTARLAVGADGRAGYRLRHRSDPLAVGGCAVAHPLLEEMIVAARLPGLAEVTFRVGLAGGQRLAVLDQVGTPRRSNRPDGTRRAAQIRGDRAGGDRAGGDPVGGDQSAGWSLPAGITVVGPGERGFFDEEAGGRRWRISARSFFQAGPFAADALADSVARLVGDPGGVVVDLYAGVGLLGGVVASRTGARLVAVERDRRAAADARRNLADLGAAVETTEVGAWNPCRAATVIADPARPGLGRPGVEAVTGTGARRLVLASCDPASLGRDAALLGAKGWRLTGVELVDVFPHTVHVEAVSAFERSGS